ncbi:MAG TPA: VCBS repeat-containing protein, partial [Gemmatimonadales bacterium]|nr:VCBS repeat-containing protein [Gemmatimonadales bacterium]
GGRLLRSETLVAPDTMSTGPIALADVDGDGDLDLFLGGRVLPGAYPVPPNSHLFINDQGRFSRSERNEAVFHQIGLVSAAVFTDINDDGQPDLALAIEWGPVRIFLNDKGSFSEVTGAWGMTRLEGGWKGVGAGDFDGDGRMDLVATNWGRNVRFPADTASPLYMYVGNFGPSADVSLLFGKFDPRINAIAPVASFSRLAWAMTDLRTRLPSFAQYADASVEQVIGEPFRRSVRIQLTTVDHTIFLNRGGHFEAVTLPAEAQEAPAFAAVPADFDGDGREDLFLGQNFSQTEVGSPRFDAGRGILLLGDGRGGFTPMPGQRSGIRIYGDQRGAAASDYDGDGRIDLAVAQNGAEVKLLHNTGAAPGLRVRLVGGPGNPGAVGARIRVRYADGDGPVREIHAGSNYWSEDGFEQVFSLKRTPLAVLVKWPGGAATEARVLPGQKVVVMMP